MRPPSRLTPSASYVAQGEPRLLRLRGLSWLTPCLVVLMLWAGLALTQAQTGAAYTAVEVGTLGEGSSRVVRAVNEGGEIAGGAPRDRGQRGFLLNGVGPQEIAGLPGSDYSVALGINKLGRVVGSANTSFGLRAFRSQRTTGIVALGPLPGDSGSAAFAINEPGAVVGFSSGPTGVRAVLWTGAGAIQALPALPGSDSSRGLAINNLGDVVGVSDTPSGPRAVCWGGGAVEDLGTLPGHGASEALSINNSGDIVGSSGDPEAQHAVLWAPGAAIEDLGTLPGGTSSRALGMNDSGEVVGTAETRAGNHAFLWTRQGGMQDLNDLTSRSGFLLTQAVAINAQGLILAIGYDEVTDTADATGHVHEDHELPIRIFRLVPEP